MVDVAGAAILNPRIFNEFLDAIIGVVNPGFEDRRGAEMDDLFRQACQFLNETTSITQLYKPGNDAVAATLKFARLSVQDWIHRDSREGALALTPAETDLLTRTSSALWQSINKNNDWNELPLDDLEEFIRENRLMLLNPRAGTILFATFVEAVTKSGASLAQLAERPSHLIADVMKPLLVNPDESLNRVTSHVIQGYSAYGSMCNPVHALLGKLLGQKVASMVDVMEQGPDGIRLADQMGTSLSQILDAIKNGRVIHQVQTSCADCPVESVCPNADKDTNDLADLANMDCKGHA